MNREHHKLNCLSLGWPMDVLSYGHWGQPLIVMPTSRGRHVEFESFGMIDALAPLIEAGRVKVYCPDSCDWDNWYNGTAHPGHRAFRYTKYMDFILHDVVPFVRAHCNSPDIRPWLTGASWGAFHASNLALKQPELFPLAICMSGAYSSSMFTNGYSDANVYLNDPVAAAWGVQPGEYRDRLARAANLLLVCGRGKWQDRSLHDTWELHRALESKGIPHGFDIWGEDSEHDWPAWRYQIRHYLEHYTR